MNTTFNKPCHKRNRLKSLVLLAVPILLFSFHMFFTKTVDDSRFHINTDPDYAYLVSSIDLARLNQSRMVMHPGTTVQLLSHLFMKAHYRLAEKKTDDFATSVLKNPGVYFNLLHHAFTYLNILLLWLLGFLLFKNTQNMNCAILFQLTPLLFAPVAIFGFRKVTSDILLVSVCLLMAWLLMKVINIQQADQTVQRWFALATTFGIIIGFGMATKITFSVIAIIPLLLVPTLLGKVVFLLSMVIAFWVCILPISANLPELVKFLFNIVTHRGIYGHGAVSILNLSDFLANLLSIFRENFPFILYLLFASVIIFVSLFASADQTRKIHLWSELHFRALASVTIAQIVAVLVVARHFKSKYLIPALIMTIAGIFLLNRYLEWLKDQEFFSSLFFAKVYRWKTKLLGLFIAVSLVNSAINVHVYFKQWQERKIEAIEIDKRIRGELRNFGIVYYYNAASPIYALKFANDWTPLYTITLQRMFGDQYFYDYQKRTFHSWDSKIQIPYEKLIKIFNGRIVFYGTLFSILREKTKCPLPDFRLQDVFIGHALALYRYPE